MPTTDTLYSDVSDSFTAVAAKVAAARSQLSVYPSTYPMSGVDTLESRPAWYQSPYTSAGVLDETLDVQAAGDIASS